MAKSTLTDRLLRGFTPSAMPPVAADGGPVIGPVPTHLPVIAPIPLCELGPCVNYHHLVTKLDAQDPLVLAEGERAEVRVQIVRTCYPSSGVEYDITDDLPRECSRWTPISQDAAAQVTQRRLNYVNKNIQAVMDFNKSWGVSTPGDEGDDDGTR